jgi:Holliday junction resolvasome RuvABC endonuclease subunit
MILLALDPGTSTGYCLVTVDDAYQWADIYKYGYIDVDTTSDFQGDHCINLMDQIQTIIDEHQVNYIAIEDYFFSKRFATGCNVNVAFRTAIHILARQNNIEYSILNVSAWKTYVAGRATPTKEQKKQWGVEASKKLYIQQALWDWWGFRFPNHSISTLTKKPIVFRYDIVDVVGQAVYYCCILCGVPYPKVSMSVKIPKDVKFTRKVKKQFIYTL